MAQKWDDILVRLNLLMVRHDVLFMINAFHNKISCSSILRTRNSTIRHHSVLDAALCVKPEA
jgi:hypothetical protein